MRADQVLETADGTQERVSDVGDLAYVVSADHQHWHYVGFDRYELRRAGSEQAVVRDRKSGFCLGDRYRVVSRVVTGAAAEASLHRASAAGPAPDLSHLVEGISVGYGDDYDAFLEYQELPLDGLPDGSYVLVHTVNAEHACGSSRTPTTRRRCSWTCAGTPGQPAVQVLASCPDTDRCDQQVRVSTVATGLEIPWDLAFLPDGAALVTERPGRVRLLTPDGRLQAEPVARIAVAREGEGGLLGLALDPEFADEPARLPLLHRRRWDAAGAVALDRLAAGA